MHEIFVAIEKYLVNFERPQHHPDEQPHTCGEADVMVLGMGRVCLLYTSDAADDC